MIKKDFTPLANSWEEYDGGGKRMRNQTSAMSKGPQSYTSSISSFYVTDPEVRDKHREDPPLSPMASVPKQALNYGLSLPPLPISIRLTSKP